MQPKFVVVRVEEHVQSEDAEAGYLVMGSCFRGGTLAGVLFNRPSHPVGIVFFVAFGIATAYAIARLVSIFMLLSHHTVLSCSRS